MPAAAHNECEGTGMKMLLLPLLAVLSMPVATSAATIEETLTQSRALAQSQQYDEALELLERSEKKYPKNGELVLMRARILSWQGKNDAAQTELSRLNAKEQRNPDVILLQASMAYQRGDHAQAERLYRQILEKKPEYTDAREGLEQVKRAQAAPEAVAYRWQLDAGYEHSDFSRVPQASWSQEFIQLTHFLPNRKTALHGKIARYEQFRDVDSEYELGVDHAITPYATMYALGHLVSDADFRPEQRLAGGGALRIIGPKDGLVPLWVTLDSRYDVYATTKVRNVNPGLRIEPWDGWALATRFITVDDDASKRVYGNDYRLDGTITDNWRFYLGYADAPETVAGVTVDTTTYFGGVSVDATPQTVLRAGYARDDRENSFIREIVNVSVGYRF